MELRGLFNATIPHHSLSGKSRQSGAHERVEKRNCEELDKTRTPIGDNLCLATD